MGFLQRYAQSHAAEILSDEAADTFRELPTVRFVKPHEHPINAV